MNLKSRTNLFLKLGAELQNLDKNKKEALLDKAIYHNPWFTTKNIELALEGIISFLKEDQLSSWLNRYNFKESAAQQQVGLVMAGNIPLVGFHDLMCVLISGNKAVIKLSSQDEVLMKYICDCLVQLEPDIESSIIIVDKLKNIDAVIATGSDNTARYFEYYFSKIPHIIRKNRTSVAVLSGNENDDDLKGLAKDMFSYFGLGCRNVSKLFIPLGATITNIFPSFEIYKSIQDHNKYANNYHYQRSIFMMEQIQHYDNGFALLRESESLVSPIGVVYYEKYKDMARLEEQLRRKQDKIQCIVSNENLTIETVPFGKAQMPEVSDYADNVDTMKFLESI